MVAGYSGGGKWSLLRRLRGNISERKRRISEAGIDG